MQAAVANNKEGNMPKISTEKDTQFNKAAEFRHTPFSKSIQCLASNTGPDGSKVFQHFFAYFNSADVTELRALVFYENNKFGLQSINLLDL